MSTMFFLSDKVGSHWDTWLYYHQDTYFLYYLAANCGTGWNGIGMAESKDGVRWKDHGMVIHASDKMVKYLGTGFIWKSPNYETDKTFLINYSEWQEVEPGKPQQRIFFCRSTDLIHWEKTDVVFDIDERYYEKTGRWDCIYPVEREEGGYYGAWTATPKGEKSGFGRIGFGYSEDGLHWTAMDTNGMFPAGQEPGAVVRVHGKYFGMFVRFAETQYVMDAYMSDHINGPYYPCKNNPLMTPRNTHFSRFFKKEQELLLNHHAISKFKAVNGQERSYFAPLKKAEISEDAITLKYWQGNEALKQLGTVKTGDFSPEAAFLMEGSLKAGETVTIGTEPKIMITLDETDLKVTCTNETVEDYAIPTADKGRRDGENADIRILMKQCVLEVYCNDYYALSYSMPFFFDGALSAPDMTVWEIEDL